VAYTGNGKSLLNGGRGEQRTGSAEEDVFQLSGAKFFQKIAAESNCAASAAGSACMNILGCVVENKGTAVCDLAAKRQAVFFSQFHQKLFSDLSQVSGYNEIIVFGAALKIFHMLFDGMIGSRCHGRSHVVGILDAKIRDGAYGAG
jgi:hypothetical protein